MKETVAEVINACELVGIVCAVEAFAFNVPTNTIAATADRKSVVKGKSFDLGGRRLLNKKKQ